MLQLNVSHVSRFQKISSGHGRPAAGCLQHLSFVRRCRPYPAGRRRASSRHAAPGLSSSPSFHARARSRPLRLPPRARAAAAHSATAPALAAASPADSSSKQHRTAPLALAVMVAPPAEQGSARIAVFPAPPPRAKHAGAHRWHGQSSRLPLAPFFLLL